MHGVIASLTKGVKPKDDQKGVVESKEKSLVVGSWARRMSKRYVYENDFHRERAGKQRDAVLHEGTTKVYGKAGQEPMGSTTAVMGVSGGGQAHRRRAK